LQVTHWRNLQVLYLQGFNARKCFRFRCIGARTPTLPGKKKIDCTRAEFKSGVSSQKVEEKNWDRNEMIVTVTSADRPRSARRSRHGRGTRQGLDVGRVYVRTPYTNTRTGQLDTSRAFGGGAQLIPKVWARIEPRMRVAPPWPLRVSSSSQRGTNYYRFLPFFFSYQCYRFLESAGLQSYLTKEFKTQETRLYLQENERRPCETHGSSTKLASGRGKERGPGSIRDRSMA